MSFNGVQISKSRHGLASIKILTQMITTNKQQETLNTIVMKVSINKIEQEETTINEIYFMI